MTQPKQSPWSKIEDARHTGSQEGQRKKPVEQRYCEALVLGAKFADLIQTYAEVLTEDKPGTMVSDMLFAVHIAASTILTVWTNGLPKGDIEKLDAEYKLHIDLFAESLAVATSRKITHDQYILGHDGNVLHRLAFPPKGNHNHK